MKKKRVVVTFHNPEVIDYIESIRHGQASSVIEFALYRHIKSETGQSMMEVLKCNQ